MTITEDIALYLPITQKARTIADEFARQQLSPEKAAQIKFNTLAILVVNDYLQMMGMETDLDAGDSWQTAIRLCVDTADLEVVGLGKLECRVVNKGESSCRLPAEVLGDPTGICEAARIGYIIVEIDENQREAAILGFVPSITTTSLPLSSLQPIDDLCSYLHSLQPSLAKGMMTTVTNLNQWLEDKVEEGWRFLEQILDLKQLQAIPAFRIHQQSDTTMIKRAKLLDLGIQLENCQVALVVELTPHNHQETAILLQVYPTGEQVFLPANLSLEVKDETGASFAQVISRSKDNLIQYQILAQPGETFSVEVSLGQAKVTEKFRI